MKFDYGVKEFELDLEKEGGPINLPKNHTAILMTLLDSALESWFDYLAENNDSMASIEPNRTARRITEVILVFNDKAVKIEVERDCAWEDYNGKHFFAKSMRLHANKCQTVKDLIDNFRGFLKKTGLGPLKKRAIYILPAWSGAFISRMPIEVQTFYFHNRELLLQSL